MSRPGRSGVFAVARSQDAIYVRLTGLGNMNNSTTFKDFADRMLVEGYRALILDLSACRGMDSTFMGILLGLRDSLLVVNAGAHSRRQMESVGLHRMLRMEDAPDPIPAALELTELPEAEPDPIARLRLIMKAHEDLIAIDRENEARFGPFLKDLARHLGSPREGP